MKKIENKDLLNQYIKTHQINQIFSSNLENAMDLFYFDKGEYICRESRKLDYLYFFLEGKAKTYSTLSNGKALLLCFYSSFQIIGELELISGNPITSNIQVVEPTYCIGIKIDLYRNLLLKDVTFLQYLCKGLSGKLARSSKNNSINLLYPLENRLSSYIYCTMEDNLFRCNLTELSELLGTSYRHLLRTINQLCDKQIIQRNKGYFNVIDESKLEELASEVYQN